MEPPAAVMATKTDKVNDLDIGSLSKYKSDTLVIEIPLAKFGSQNHVFIIPAVNPEEHMEIDRKIYTPDEESCHACNIAEPPLIRFDITETIYQLIMCEKCLDQLFCSISQIEDEDIISAII